MMTTKLILIVMCFVTVTANAATRTTIVTEIQRGNNTEKRTDVFTVDGNKARLDMYFGQETGPATTSSMLTVDDGNTWYLSDPKAGKTVCTKWNTREFFRGVGELILYAEDLAGADVSEGKFEVLLDEPGPDMLGQKTRHLKLRYSMNAVARILFFKREYTLEFSDEIWTSSELKLHPVEQTWIDAMSETGYTKIDRLSKKWNEKVPGTVIKMVSDVTMHNITKQKKKQKQERMQITRNEMLKSEDIPAETFNVPGCEKVTEDEMEQAAKDMLKGIAK